jgi:hypothetical protein
MLALIEWDLAEFANWSFDGKCVIVDIVLQILQTEGLPVKGDGRCY